MKIGLNGQKLLVANPAGVEKYMYSIFSGLAKVDKENEYTVYVDSIPPVGFFEKLTHKNPNFSHKTVGSKKGRSWTQTLLRRELQKNPVDVVFYPFDTITGLLPLLKPKKFKAVCMMHDLGYVKAKEYKNPLRRILHFYTLWYVLLFAKKIIVPSEGAKKEILRRRWFGFKKNKIIVIPEGLNENFKKKSLRDVNVIREKYNLKARPYLYFVSTIQPRKNIPRIVEAFSSAIKEKPDLSETLLLISGKRGWSFEESLEAPKKFGIEKNVRFLGRTSDEDIPVLMSGSEGLVNVSLEEGFGLPILEAMSCETPVLASKIPALKEIGKDLILYANPEDANDIKNKIIDLLTKRVEKPKLKKAWERSQEFTWEKAAKRTLEVLKTA